jgi:hypothetical protein
VCYPPQANFIIWLAGKPGPKEKRGIFLGFFTCNTPSPKPKIHLKIYQTQSKNRQENFSIKVCGPKGPQTFKKSS